MSVIASGRNLEKMSRPLRRPGSRDELSDPDVQNAECRYRPHIVAASICSRVEFSLSSPGTITPDVRSVSRGGAFSKLEKLFRYP
jgi:hypothetical protein